MQDGIIGNSGQQSNAYRSKITNFYFGDNSHRQNKLTEQPRNIKPQSKKKLDQCIQYKLTTQYEERVATEIESASKKRKRK